MTTTNLFIADLHINSTVSLCPPSFTLDDGGTYQASRGQRWLFENWERLLERAAALPNLAVHVVGDLAEADIKNRSTQMITRNTADIIRLASDTLEPLAKMSQALFVYRGTTAHVGISASVEETIADDLGAIADPETGRKAWWANLYLSDGVTMEIAHHPRGSTGRPHLRYGSVDRMAQDTIFTYAQRLERPPQLVIRGHLHQHLDSGTRYITRALLLPCWTLATEYTHRIAPLALAEIGAVLVHCDGGRYEVEPIIYKPEGRRYFALGGL